MLPGGSSFATTLDRGNSVGSQSSDGFAHLRQPEYGVGATQPEASASTSRPSRRELSQIESIIDQKRAGAGPLGLHEEEYDEDEYWEDEEEDDSRFVNFSLISHIAVRLRDKVPRGTHVKGSIPYPRAFTGKDIVVRTPSTFSHGCPYF